MMALFVVATLLGCTRSDPPVPREEGELSPELPQRHERPEGAQEAREATVDEEAADEVQEAAEEGSAGGEGDDSEGRAPTQQDEGLAEADTSDHVLPSARSFSSFAEELCPYPEMEHIDANSCFRAGRERLRCLENLLRREQLRMAEEGDVDWLDQERLYGIWHSARCAHEDDRQWVDLASRTWSFGSHMGTEDLCNQRMIEERLFLHAARRGGLKLFWERVESRQDAGRRAKAKMERALAITEQPPVPEEEPSGTEYPDLWRVFVGQLQTSLSQPELLADSHCSALSGGVGCRERFELYLHSISVDPRARPDCDG